MKHEDQLVEISAYIDGELSPEEFQSMSDHLASCGDCAAQYQMLLTTSRRVKEGYDVPRMPEALRARVRESLRNADHPAETLHATPTRLPWLRLVAAAVIVATISSATTVAVARRTAPASSVASEVLASHIRSLMPGHLTDVQSNDTHNVKPWFNGRLDLSPNVPRLDSLGFPLVGGRLDYVGGRAIAAVVYARRQHVINVFSWPSREGTQAPRVVVSENGYHLMTWRTNGAEHWAASDVNVADLEQFVQLYTRSDDASKEP
jgi:anti-sigma factor RsiW